MTRPGAFHLAAAAASNRDAGRDVTDATGTLASLRTSLTFARNDEEDTPTGTLGTLNAGGPYLDPSEEGRGKSLRSPLPCQPSANRVPNVPGRSRSTAGGWPSGARLDALAGGGDS